MRSIKDDIVVKNLEKLEKSGKDYVDLLPRYNNNVNTTIEKIKLEKSPLGIKPRKVEDSLMEKFKELKMKEGPCYVKAGDNKYLTTPKKMRMLKALAIEQINPDAGYSELVAMLFSQLLKSIVVGAEPIWERPVNTMYDSCVFDKLVNCIEREVAE